MSVTNTEQVNYGKALGEQIRARLIAKEVKHDDLTDYERFLLDRGFEFHTEEALKSGFARRMKSSQGIALTEEEFITEAQGNFPSNYDVDTLKEVYSSLTELVRQKKLTIGDIHGYALFKWCLRSPEALIAYEREQGKWEVNNCETEVSEDTAKVLVNGEWGFEASRIQVIGQAYYESTDWQFIRFDCAHMTWLWTGETLYQVYA